jgi:trehalose-6-phosphate synthase
VPLGRPLTSVPRWRRRSAAATPIALIAYHTTPLSAFSLVALYRLAHFCIVSSLHDGMNLVAKEFVAARDDERGVLMLRALAGAAGTRGRGDRQSL